MIDFKIYYSLPIEYLIQYYKQEYVATVNELFHERLSQRFADYFNRIALPEFQSKKRIRRCLALGELGS